MVESRPSEKGRCVIVEVNLRIKDGHSIDKLPKDISVRSKIHEYGGGAMSMSSDGSFIVTDATTDSVLSISPTGQVKEEIIKGDARFRYGDFDVHPFDTHLILAVQEEHREKEVINTVALINAQTNKAEIAVEGADFYSHPKFSHDGRKVSWIQWNHPDMPWTGTELYVADWLDGKVVHATKVAGNAKTESINQPKWHLDDTLLFSSDITGFWQLYQYDTKAQKIKQLVLEGYEDADFAGREMILGV